MVTLNLTPGESVYGEKRMSVEVRIKVYSLTKHDIFTMEINAISHVKQNKEKCKKKGKVCHKIIC